VILENAVECLVHNVQQVITQWIDTLPVTNDEEAAPYAYAYLAQLIDQ